MPKPDGVHTPLALNRLEIFQETPVFIRQVKDSIDDEDYRLLKARLPANPDAGDLIRRSGGLRRFGVGIAGSGKRGGARVPYCWVTAKSPISMLVAYAKNVQEDLTEDPLRVLRARVKQEFG